MPRTSLHKLVQEEGTLSHSAKYNGRVIVGSFVNDAFDARDRFKARKLRRANSPRAFKEALPMNGSRVGVQRTHRDAVSLPVVQPDVVSFRT